MHAMPVYLKRPHEIIVFPVSVITSLGILPFFVCAKENLVYEHVTAFLKNFFKAIFNSYLYFLNLTSVNIYEGLLSNLYTSALVFSKKKRKRKE